MRRRAQRSENRDKLNAIKLECGCADCGYNAHPAALDFDHVDGKLGGVSQAARHRGWAWVEAEIARCEVVCANCHRVRTAERGQWHAEREAPVAAVDPQGWLL